MIDVTCAVISYGNKVLAVQRGPTQDLPGKWEFPGGKVEQNESEEECLIREIREELCLDIQLNRRLHPVEHVYDRYTIRLIPFTATILGGKILLTEHQDYTWLSPVNLESIDWAPADLPIVYQLQDNWKSR
ncbi:(deoxy)nucleoside triphosphate pyrophosphohydrolase [Lunatibacter salilacus]|uniref:(deoxy)nucleoside triphosphate pyrophosphohydrolase n=1 Tax=Lunatibacter salilacus TaxID=2483804 RepID=UPI00131B791B|nr:(deoxy)nucleoside triphosphate pyrophosphohydrolase [Lunatibacter salilacus]